MFHNYLEWNVSHYCLTKAVPRSKVSWLRKTAKREECGSWCIDSSVTAFDSLSEESFEKLRNNQGWTLSFLTILTK